jgi:D-threonine aldolase
MSQPAPAAVGAPLEQIDTPALVLDLPAFERNQRTLFEAVRGRGVRVRPHAKTHKCPEVGKRQLAMGAVGMCCQKVSEDEAMVDGGVGDVLVSNEIVGAQKIERLAALSRRAKIGVCVDNAENLRAIAASGARLDIYIEIDVGMRRCGVAPGERAVMLAKEIVKNPNLRFVGLQAYHGRAQHIRSMEERHAVIETAAQHVAHTK